MILRGVRTTKTRGGSSTNPSTSTNGNGSTVGDGTMEGEDVTVVVVKSLGSIVDDDGVGDVKSLGSIVGGG